jgi:hypothetical protein
MKSKFSNFFAFNASFFISFHQKQWAMGGTTKSRCHLGMLKVSSLKHSYPKMMKLGDCGPTRECLNNNHETLQMLYIFFIMTFKVQTRQTPFLNQH